MADRKFRGGLVKLVLPHQKVPSHWHATIWVFWILFLMALWQFFPSPLLPRPLEILTALKDLWFDKGLAEHLWISYAVQLKALVLAAGASVLLAYLSSIAIFRPIITLISVLRFISLGPLVIFFTLLITSEGHLLKIWILVFAITVIYVTAMLPIVLETPTDELDHAKTLHMNSWRSLWEVTVLGRADTAWDMLRQNAAMGFMMITMVESLVRSEGGIGTLIQNNLKHFALAEVAAMILVLFIIGFLQDLALQFLRRKLFPYASLEGERR